MRRSRAFYIVITAACCVSFVGFASAQSEPGRSFAFLVACGDYDPSELKPVPFTLHEMKLFHDVLIASGTPAKNIVYLHDKTDQPGRFVPNRTNILREYKLLLERLRPEDTLVVALSGHGIQYRADASGYFCPLDARLGPAHKNTLVAMEGAEGLLTLLEISRAQRKLVLVNACRNEPATSAVLAAERLALRDDYNEEAPRGTVVVFACSKGQRSYFYPETEKRLDRRNRSLFMYHITEAWKGSYAQGRKVTLDHVLSEVRERVEDEALRDFRNNQMPLARKKNFEGSWLLVAARASAIANSIGMKLAYIPPGKFLMGSPKEEKDRSTEEFQHEVEITRGFYMGIHEVTQEEYTKVMGSNPSAFSLAGVFKAKVVGMDTLRFPVEQVAWDDAKEFCRRLTDRERTPELLALRAHTAATLSLAQAKFQSAKQDLQRAQSLALAQAISQRELDERKSTFAEADARLALAQADLDALDRQGKIYRLPTEAEWEYACRAGTTTPFHTGETIAATQANFAAQYPDAGAGKTEFRSMPLAVGSLAANIWGLCDMHGNVREWCEDHYDANFYTSAPRTNPLNLQKSAARVLRGGSWVVRAGPSRSAARSGRAASDRVNDVGFRVVLTSGE